jgi:WD40 repeat protein
MNFLTKRVQQLCQDQEIEFPFDLHKVVFNNVLNVALFQSTYHFHVFDMRSKQFIIFKNFSLNWNIHSAEHLGFIYITNKSIELMDAFSLEITRTWKRNDNQGFWFSFFSKGLIQFQSSKINFWSWEHISQDLQRRVHSVDPSLRVQPEGLDVRPKAVRLGNPDTQSEGFPKPEKSMRAPPISSLQISKFAFSPSGKWLVVGTQTSKIVIFDLSFANPPREIVLFPTNYIWIMAICFLPGIKDESKILFARTDDNQNDKIFQYDMVSGTVSMLVDIQFQNKGMWIQKLDIFQNPITKKYMIFVQTDVSTHRFFTISLNENLQVSAIKRFGSSIQTFHWNAKRHFAIAKTDETKYFIHKK